MLAVIKVHYLVIKYIINKQQQIIVGSTMILTSLVQRYMNT